MNSEKILERDKKWLCFTIQSQRYLLPINQVREVITSISLDEIPGSNAFVEGMVTIRGDLMTVISGRKVFGCRSSTNSPQNGHIIVIELTESLYGLTVDQVDEIIVVDEEQISKDAANNAFIVGTVHLQGSLYILTDLIDIHTILE